MKNVIDYLTERASISKKVDILEELNKVTQHQYTKQGSMYVSKKLDQDELLDAVYKDEVIKDIFLGPQDTGIFSEEELLELRPTEDDEDDVELKEEYVSNLWNASEEANLYVVCDILTNKIHNAEHVSMNLDITPYDPMGFEGFFKLTDSQANDLVQRNGDYIKAGLGIVLTKSDYTKENFLKHSFQYYLNVCFSG
jgi:hypothetical protein